MKSIAVLLNLLQYFYHRIQYAKTHNFAYSDVLKYSMKYTDFKV